MSLNPYSEDRTKYVVELELTTHSGETPIMGLPEYNRLHDLVYGPLETIPPVILYLGGYFMAPTAESSVPSGMLAVPESKCTKLGIDADDLPRSTDVIVVSEQFSNSICLG